MKAECCLKSERVVKNCMKNETECMICKSTVFKVGRVTSQLVMLTCVTCGEPHMIGADLDENRISLLFWDSETGDIQ